MPTFDLRLLPGCWTLRYYVGLRYRYITLHLIGTLYGYLVIPGCYMQLRILALRWLRFDVVDVTVVILVTAFV